MLLILGISLLLLLLYFYKTSQNSSKISQNSSKIQVYKGDITKLNIECIVNASNSSGLGCHIPNHCIDSAIHLAAGPKLLEECKTLNGIPTGTAKLTKGYNLPAKYVIHCTGPNAENDGINWQ